MKKLFAVLLSLILGLTSVFALAEEAPMAGGWTACPGEIPQEASEAFEKAFENWVGTRVEPIALLATQVVAGVNYCFFCRVIPVVPNAVPHYSLVYVYADLGGETTVMDFADLEIGLYAEENSDWESEEEAEDEPGIAGRVRIEEAGSVLTVRLRANVTTGYAWTFEIEDGSIAELLTDEYVEDDHPEGMVGVGGTYAASFVPAGIGDGAFTPGTTQIVFTYGRSWEPDRPAAYFRMSMEVREDGTVVCDSCEFEEVPFSAE